MARQLSIYLLAGFTWVQFVCACYGVHVGVRVFASLFISAGVHFCCFCGKCGARQTQPKTHLVPTEIDITEVSGGCNAVAAGPASSAQALSRRPRPRQPLFTSAQSRWRCCCPSPLPRTGGRVRLYLGRAACTSFPPPSPPPLDTRAKRYSLHNRDTSSISRTWTWTTTAGSRTSTSCSSSAAWACTSPAPTSTSSCPRST